MRDLTLGQYYPSNSVVHRLDARVKLILAVVYVVTVFFIDSFYVYGVFLVFTLFLILLSRVPLRRVLKSLKMILFLMIFTAVMTLLLYRGDDVPLWQAGIIKIYKSGLMYSGKMILRLITIVLGPTLLTFTTTPTELTDALESLMFPLKKTHIPHFLAMVMSIALRLIPTLVEETDKIIAAQKARCADFESKNLFKRAKAMIPVLIPLFVSSFRRADELADAMDSRCYRGAIGRTRMKKMRFGLKDAFALLLFCAVLFGILLVYYNFFKFNFSWLI